MLPLISFLSHNMCLDLEVETQMVTCLFHCWLLR